MAYRWFIGYPLNEQVPHFSTVSYNFRHRFNTASVEYIFRWVLKAAADEGYLDTEAIFVDGTHIKAIVQEYLEKQSMRRTPDLQKEEPSISSPPIDLIASALTDFRGERTIQKKGFRQQMRKPFLRRRIVNISFSFRRESYRWPPRPSCGRG